MIANVAIGVVAAAATVAGVWLARPGGAALLEDTAGATSYLELPTVAAPLFSEGRVRAYALVRLGVELNEKALASLAVPAEALIIDALHDLAFEGALDASVPDFELDALRERVVERMDAPLGGALERAVVLQVDVLRKDEIRSRGLQRRARAAALRERGEDADGTTDFGEAPDADEAASDEPSEGAGD